MAKSEGEQSKFQGRRKIIQSRKKFGWWIASAFSLCGGFVLLASYRAFGFVADICWNCNYASPDELAKWGDFPGGTTGILWAAAATIVLIVTYLSQQEDILLQMEELQETQTEMRDQTMHYAQMAASTRIATLRTSLIDRANSMREQHVRIGARLDTFRKTMERFQSLESGSPSALAEMLRDPFYFFASTIPILHHLEQVITELNDLKVTVHTLPSVEEVFQKDMLSAFSPIELRSLEATIRLWRKTRGSEFEKILHYIERYRELIRVQA